MKPSRRRSIPASRCAISPHPTFEFEQLLWKQGVLHVAGVDEAGRGAWAGPLVAAAAILPSSEQSCLLINRFLSEAGVSINDSKRLSHPDRELALELAIKFGARIKTFELSSHTVDLLGLGNSNRVALCQVVEKFHDPPGHVLIDYFSLPELRTYSTSITKGDQHSVSIALASIAAKVHRDSRMTELSRQYPEYLFEKNKGYGTQKHAEAIARHGVIDQHRRCFRPVREALAGG